MLFGFGFLSLLMLGKKLLMSGVQLSNFYSQRTTFFPCVKKKKSRWWGGEDKRRKQATDKSPLYSHPASKLPERPGTKLPTSYTASYLSPDPFCHSAQQCGWVQTTME